jgi:hypothetical protein
VHKDKHGDPMGLHFFHKAGKYAKNGCIIATHVFSTEFLSQN